MFPRLCCFRLTTVFENCHSDTPHNIQDINLPSYFKMACVKSVQWPALVSNVVDVSLSGESLGYWTACNNVKRYCTVPYCAYVNSNWRYSPETAKLGFDLCDLDLWPFAWTPLLSLVITTENFMMIRWWEHSEKGVTDRQMDWTIHRAAWLQLKRYICILPSTYFQPIFQLFFT